MRNAPEQVVPLLANGQLRVVDQKDVPKPVLCRCHGTIFTQCLVHRGPDLDQRGNAQGVQSTAQAPVVESDQRLEFGIVQGSLDFYAALGDVRQLVPPARKALVHLQELPSEVSSQDRFGVSGVLARLLQ